LIGVARLIRELTRACDKPKKKTRASSKKCLCLESLGHAKKSTLLEGGNQRKHANERLTAEEVQNLKSKA